MNKQSYLWDAFGSFELREKQDDGISYFLTIYIKGSSRPVKVNIGVLDIDAISIYQEFKSVAKNFGVYEFKVQKD